MDPSVALNTLMSSARLWAWSRVHPTGQCPEQHAMDQSLIGRLLYSSREKEASLTDCRLNAIISKTEKIEKTNKIEK